MVKLSFWRKKKWCYCPYNTEWPWVCIVHLVPNIFKGFGFMMFNPTFNNISVISWRSILLVEKTTDLSLTNFITISRLEYTSPWVGLNLTTLVVIGTDFIGSCKSNYHTITTIMSPKIFKLIPILVYDKYKP